MPSLNLARFGQKSRSPTDRSEVITPAPSTTHSTTPSRRRSIQTDYSEKDSSAAGNPFETPIVSTTASSINFTRQPEPGYFHSRRVRKEDLEKPWLTEGKDKRLKWQTLIPAIGLFLGFAIGAYMVYDGWTSVPVHQYCSVYEDDFSSGHLDPKIWTKEVQVGGFGNGQFEETTGTDENVFIQDGMLTIKPTLQDASLITHNSTLNLTALGTCTSNFWADCVAVTNTTNGTIVNPVKSARINTKKGATIKFGRIEVVAKYPAGDWLWPAIWMLPVKSVYGEWPLSGEIDIAESRGNNHTYPGGNNNIGSTLHWGPDQSNDGWWRTFGNQPALHQTFADSFHTFGIEWSEKYIYMYLDNRLLQVLYVKFNNPFWKRGNFPLSNENGTAYVDPWSQTGSDATPFDQDFYLILNIAVGGTNGWFKDGVANKPWVDASPTAKRDFWNAKDQWLPTWTDPTMQVKSVKIWQQKGYNGC